MDPQTETKTTKNTRTPATSDPVVNEGVFNPNAYESKTPIKVVSGPASAVPVHSVYRPSVNGKRAVEIYFALIGRNGCEFNEVGLPTRCAVIRGTWWLTGTRNDDKSKAAFSAVCKAMGYTPILTSFEVATAQAWCDAMVAEIRPVTLVLEPDGDSDRYQRIRFVNRIGSALSSEYLKAMEDTGLLVNATAQAIETANKIADSGAGGGDDFDLAQDIPF